MQDIDELLERPVANLTSADLRALGYKCLMAAKSQTDRTLRARLLERSLKLAQLAEELEAGLPSRRGPHKRGGTPGPDNPEA
jgi:hypothetical protein